MVLERERTIIATFGGRVCAAECECEETSMVPFGRQIKHCINKRGEGHKCGVTSARNLATVHTAAHAADMGAMLSALCCRWPSETPTKKNTSARPLLSNARAPQPLERHN